MKSIKRQLITAALVLATLLGLSALPIATTYAVNPADQVGQGVNTAGGEGQQLKPQIANVINVLLFVVGAVAVIMIVLGGLRYVLSNGDSSQITAAKNTVLYSVIGLVVALLGYAIVNFVVAQF